MSTYDHNDVYLSFSIICDHTIDGLLYPVRPFPGDILKFQDTFKRCTGNCLSPKCCNAHSDLELKAWNKLKQG